MKKILFITIIISISLLTLACSNDIDLDQTVSHYEETQNITVLDYHTPSSDYIILYEAEDHYGVDYTYLQTDDLKSKSKYEWDKNKDDATYKLFATETDSYVIILLHQGQLSEQVVRAEITIGDQVIPYVFKEHRLGYLIHIDVAVDELKEPIVILYDNDDQEVEVSISK